MHGILVLVIFCVALGLYGFFLSRKISARYYTLVNLLAGAGSLIFARLVGVNWANLGLEGNSIKGILIGLFIASIILVLVFVLKRNFHPAKVARYELFVRIPLGTALAEELIFRGSLMGILLQSYGKLTSLIISSIIFGFWHILPNPMTNWAHENLATKLNKNWQRYTVSASATVLFTFFGGLAFGLLRLVSGSVLAPWIVHSSTNIVGLLLDTASKQPRKPRSSRS